MIPLSAKKEPIRLVWKEPEPEAQGMAEIVGNREVGEAIDASTDYSEADFGWMDDAVSKGYPVAITSLVCER